MHGTVRRGKAQAPVLAYLSAHESGICVVGNLALPRGNFLMCQQWRWNARGPTHAPHQAPSHAASGWRAETLGLFMTVTLA